MSFTGTDVLVFAAELGCYSAVAVAGWGLHPLLGMLAVLAMATWWGLLHAPRARLRLPRSIDIALRIAWFSIALPGSASASQPDCTSSSDTRRQERALDWNSHGKVRSAPRQPVRRRMLGSWVHDSRRRPSVRPELAGRLERA